MLQLDDRDLEILRILSRHGRISKSDLARQINLSLSPCLERLKKLEDAGIISGYRASVDLRKLAPHVVVFVLVELDAHKSENFQKFERAIARHDEITACWALGGGFDYLLQVVAQDIDSYQRLIDTLLDARIGLARYFTYVVTKPVKEQTGFPMNLFSTSRSEN